MILPATLLIVSCTPFNTNNSVSNSDSISSSINHEYHEIENKKIAWNDVFSLAKVQYFVYFYSKTCSHCQQFKNTIIEYGLRHNDFYFCEDCKDTIISNDVGKTIGINSINSFCIQGFPSLVKIEKGVCVINVAGISNISLILGV